MTTLGMADVVSEYGADPTGARDASREINHALETTQIVVVPGGAVCACNAPIVVGEARTLIVLGTLIRKASLSPSTRPVVILNGDYACLKGGGRAGLIRSENDSPDGVVLWGVESPVRAARSTAVRWANVQDLMVFGNGSATASRGIVCQSMQAYGRGALFDAHFHNIHVYDVADGIYCNSIANGNTFDKINFFRVHRYAIHVDGASENHDGQSFLASDNNFFDIFVDVAAPTFRAVIRGRSCTLTNFIGVHAEPEHGVYADIDGSCSRLTLVSTMNVGDPGTFDAGISTYVVNGVARFGEYAGEMASRRGTRDGVPSGVATTLFAIARDGEFLEVTARVRGAPFHSATCVAVRTGGGRVTLLNNASSAAEFRLLASGAEVQVSHRVGHPVVVDWRARTMSEYPAGGPS